MTESNHIISKAEKVKAFAMGIIGTGIFSMGTTYFSAQAEYRIPRILWPVYEIFGHVGLAVGMILLGSLLIFLAYRKFTAQGGKGIYLISTIGIAIVGFYVIAFFSGNKPTNLQAHQQNTERRIADSRRPKLESAVANSYLDQLEALVTKYEMAVRQKDKTIIAQCESEYLHLSSEEFEKVLQEIATKPEYSSFAMYNAKLLTDIQALRVSQK